MSSCWIHTTTKQPQNLGKAVKNHPHQKLRECCTSLASQSHLSPTKSIGNAHVQVYHGTNDNISFQNPVPKGNRGQQQCRPQGCRDTQFKWPLNKVLQHKPHPSCQPSHAYNTFNLSNSLLIPTRNSRGGSTSAWEAAGGGRERKK